MERVANERCSHCSKRMTSPHSCFHSILFSPSKPTRLVTLDSEQVGSHDASADRYGHVNDPWNREDASKDNEVLEVIILQCDSNATLTIMRTSTGWPDPNTWANVVISAKLLHFLHHHLDSSPACKTKQTKLEQPEE